MSRRATRGMMVLATARTVSSGTNRLAPQTSAFAPSRAAVPKRGVMEFDDNTIALLPPAARNAGERRKVTETRRAAYKERVPSARISSKQYRCNRRAVQFRKLFDFSAPALQGCLNMRGCRAKLQVCGEN